MKYNTVDLVYYWVALLLVGALASLTLFDVITGTFSSIR